MSTIQVDIPTVSTSADAVDGVDQLRELMCVFTQTTERLERTHVTLQEEVARLKGELEEANARLRRTRQLAALGEMAAGIAHEIRNPLGAIQLNLQMLGEDLAGAPAQSQLCEKIGRSVTTLDSIVRDVLLFSRDMTIRTTPTSARDLVDQALESCEGFLAAGGIELLVRVPDDRSCDLHAEPGLLSQALANVVRNAVEAMEEHGPAQRRIAIAAARRRARGCDRRRASRVVLSVEDNGPGIPAEVVERMFNPFFTTRRTGTGLGLAIVHRIVDAHGGHIDVTNLEAGGARVELCLPLESPISPTVPSSPSQPTGHRPAEQVHQ